MITGRCECGAVTYTIEGEINDYSHCHCSQCRRLHGAAFGSYGGVDRSAFRWRSGESGLTTYASSAKNDRVFCQVCGSLLLTVPNNEPDRYYVTMGTMNGNPALPPGYHIYVGSRADWYAISDDLPQFERAPSGEN